MPRVIRKYPRIETSVDNQRILRENGFFPVFSSNVSAIKRVTTTLVIRFHNGAVYSYPNQGKRYNDLLTSPSKGEWVWNELRRKNVSYFKSDTMPLDGDLDLTTDEMMTRLADMGLLVQALQMVKAINPVIQPINVVTATPIDSLTNIFIQSIAKI